jgi:phage terminase small subunit
MRTKKRAPRPPADLATAGRRLWTGVLGDYELTERHHLELLRQACVCLDRAEQARAEIERLGVVVLDRWGQPRTNPACAVERDARALAIRSLAALGLDLEPAGHLEVKR